MKKQKFQAAATMVGNLELVLPELNAQDFFWVGAPPSWFPSMAHGRHTNSGLVALPAPRGPTLSGTVYPSPPTIVSPVWAPNGRLR